jgi:hypothetical protein
LNKNATGSPKRWQYSQADKNNTSFELPYSNSQNIMNICGVNDDSKQKRGALSTNKQT